MQENNEISRMCDDILSLPVTSHLYSLNDYLRVFDIAVENENYTSANIIWTRADAEYHDEGEDILKLKRVFMLFCINQYDYAKRLLSTVDSDDLWTRTMRVALDGTDDPESVRGAIGKLVAETESIDDTDFRNLLALAIQYDLLDELQSQFDIIMQKNNGIQGGLLALVDNIDDSNPDFARRVWDEITRADIHDAETWARYSSYCLRMLQDNDEALEAAEFAIAIDPSNPTAQRAILLAKFIKNGNKKPATFVKEATKLLTPELDDEYFIYKVAQTIADQRIGESTRTDALDAVFANYVHHPNSSFLLHTLVFYYEHDENQSDEGLRQLVRQLLNNCDDDESLVMGISQAFRASGWYRAGLLLMDEYYIRYNKTVSNSDFPPTLVETQYLLKKYREVIVSVAEAYMVYKSSDDKDDFRSALVLNMIIMFGVLAAARLRDYETCKLWLGTGMNVFPMDGNFINPIDVYSRDGILRTLHSLADWLRAPRHRMADLDCIDPFRVISRQLDGIKSK